MSSPAAIPPLCALGESVLPVAEARISPLDRGFLFGDGVYETMKVLAGHPLFLRQHLARLDASLAGLAIPQPRRLVETTHALLAATGPFDGSLYVQVTRGAFATRQHRPPTGGEPTLFVLPSQIAFPDLATATGWSAISRPDWRWRRGDLKSTSLAAAVLGNLEVARAGVDEILWIGDGGELREGGHTNLFVRRGDRLETHPLGTTVLPGVTRACLLELAADLEIPVVERTPRLAELASWREAFVCGTLTGVRGIVSLDGHSVGGGVVGEWTRALAVALAEREQEEARR